MRIENSFKKTDLKKQSDIDLNATYTINNKKAGNTLSYLLFALFETRVKYNDIETDDILLFLYLYELKHFYKYVNIIGVKYNVEVYVSLGYVLPDYENKNKKYFKYSDKLKELVEYFVSILKNKYNYINENRINYEMDFDSLVKSILVD